MDLVNKELSKDLDLVVKLEAGVAKLSLKYEGALAGASVEVNVSAELLVQKLADAIPGKIDDLILQALLAAVK